MKKLLVCCSFALAIAVPCFAQSGNALHFDGVDDYVEFSPMISYTGTFTVMAWVKTLDNSGAIFSWGSPVTNDFAYVQVYMGHLRLRIGDGASDDIDGTATIGDDNWNHIAVVKDNTNIYFYVNGVLDITASSSKVPSPTSTSIGGGLINGAYQEFFEGTIDEVSIWNIAFSGTEIPEMIYHIQDVDAPDLAAYYQFNEGAPCGINTSFTTLPDVSANGHTGTLMSFDLSGACTSNWVTSDAMKQNCLHFEGSDDYVSCTLPSVFCDISNNSFTIEAWVYPEAAVFSRIIFAQYDASNFACLSYSNLRQVYVYFVHNGTYVSPNKTDGTLPLNQWTHLAVSWDATGNSIHVYFNGLEQTLVTGGTSTTGTNNLMTIGSRPDGYQYFPGMLDEIRIWDHVLTQCEISSGMNFQMKGSEAGLQALYSFNQGIPHGNNATETTLIDQTGNGYDGTLLNFALINYTSNWLLSNAALAGLYELPAPVFSLDTTSICDGDTLQFGTQILTTAGTYTAVLQTVLGCDSIVQLELYINPVYNDTIPGDIFICENDSYSFGSQVLTATGIYTENFVSSQGCDSLITISLVVNNNPVVAIQGVTHACDSTILDEGIGIPGDIYLWSTSETTQTITVTTTGDYSLTVTDGNGCLGSDTVSVIIDNIMDVNLGPDEYVCDTVTLMLDAGTGYDSYLWSTGDTTQTISVDSTGIGLGTGVFSVTVTSGLCERIDTIEITFTICSAIGETDGLTGLSVYPNPSGGDFELAFYNTITGKISVKLYDLAGRIILAKDFMSIEQGAILPVNTGYLPEGTYLLEVETHDTTYRRNLVIQR